MYCNTCFSVENLQLFCSDVCDFIYGFSRNSSHVVVRAKSFILKCVDASNKTDILHVFSRISLDNTSAVVSHAKSLTVKKCSLCTHIHVLYVLPRKPAAINMYVRICTQGTSQKGYRQILGKYYRIIQYYWSLGNGILTTYRTKNLNRIRDHPRNAPITRPGTDMDHVEKANNIARILKSLRNRRNLSFIIEYLLKIPLKLYS